MMPQSTLNLENQGRVLTEELNKMLFRTSATKEQSFKVKLFEAPDGHWTATMHTKDPLVKNIMTN